MTLEPPITTEDAGIEKQLRCLGYAIDAIQTIPPEPAMESQVVFEDKTKCQPPIKIDTFNSLPDDALFCDGSDLSVLRKLPGGWVQWVRDRDGKPSSSVFNGTAATWLTVRPLPHLRLRLILEQRT